MSIPDYQSLMLPVLRVAAKGETSVPLAEGQIAAMFALPQEARDQMLPSGKQRVLHNRIHWAKFYLTKAGYLETPRRGRFAITPAGSALLANPPAKLDTQYLLSVPAFREFYRADQAQETIGATPQDAAPAATPEEVIEAAFNATQAALRTELLERTLQNGPGFFEGLIVDLLVAMGYGGSHRNAAAQLGRTGDGGVDGVINEDVLGLDRVYVQAKRYAPGTSVGRPDVQAFTGSLVGLGATKGVFVTTSTFSPQAVEFAARIPQRVILIDGKRLTELMIEHGVGVRSSRVLEFKRIDEDFFVEE
ncbi:restriction endonuclease [Prosthecomicrobium pneumaticum]|uniref:Restriction system protein n=1 Tax=Prosthecomicrobium pneumaticum TaxID=81895 RepID=A0A7W9FPT4_9HYPH|nr:restriction endonuclease [Prosthecomicrobium pneumaticum]MBB5754577.1 restriction system protein [Prosthecomicrobium pneumaticum]